MEQMKTAHEVEEKFGKTFMQHVERLAGTALPVVNFPIDTATLACFVLLAEREARLKSNASTRRFTYDDLSLEISGLGIPTNGKLKEVIRGMERAGYVRVQEGSFLVSEIPLLELCRLLDEIFPRMPGLNLVAYLVQTMEEVLSGRKGLGEAHLQLDQVLEMHGVPLSGSQGTPDGKKTASPSSKTTLSHQKDGREKRKKGSEEKNRRTRLKLLQAAAREEGQKKKVLSSRLIRSGDTMAAGSGEKRSEKPDGASVEKSFQEGLPLPAHTEKMNDAKNSEVEREGLEETDRSPVETVPPEQSKKTEKKEENKDQLPSESDAEKAGDTLPDVGKQKDVLSDAAIEERISAFEEDLAMTCPLCGKGRIELRETAKGKRFYECSRDGCYFISWGKPYHLTCPGCGNNFLIETVDTGGKAFLKCPRATCNHKQNLPGQDGPFENIQEKGKKKKQKAAEKPARKPKKKVVRRRLVRRKK